MEEAFNGQHNARILNNRSYHAESQELQTHKICHPPDFHPNCSHDQSCITKSQHFSTQNQGFSHDPQDREELILKNSGSMRNNNFQLSKFDLSHSKSKIRMYGSKKNLLAYTALVSTNQCEGQEFLKQKGKSSKDIQNSNYLNLKRPLSGHQDRPKKRVICSKKNVPPDFTFVEPLTKIDNCNIFNQQKNNIQPHSQSIDKQNRKEACSKIKLFGRQRKITAQIDLISQSGVNLRNCRLTQIKNYGYGQEYGKMFCLSGPESKFKEDEDDFNIKQAEVAQRILFESIITDDCQRIKCANNKQSLLSNKTIKSKNDIDEKQSQEEERKPKFQNCESKEQIVNMTLTISQMENHQQIALIKLSNSNNYNYYCKVPSVILTPSKKVKAHFQYIFENDKEPKSIRHGQLFNQKQSEEEFIARLTHKKNTLAQISKKLQQMEDLRNKDEKNIFEAKKNCEDDLEKQCNQSRQKVALDNNHNKDINIKRMQQIQLDKNLDQQSISRKSETSIVDQARRFEQQQMRALSKNSIQERVGLESLQQISNENDMQCQSSSQKNIEKRLRNTHRKSSNLSSMKKSSVVLSSTKKIKAHVDYIFQTSEPKEDPSKKQVTILSSNKSLNAYIQNIEEPEAQQSIYDYGQDDAPQRADFILESENSLKQNSQSLDNLKGTVQQKNNSQKSSVSSSKFIDEFLQNVNESIVNSMNCEGRQVNTKVNKIQREQKHESQPFSNDSCKLCTSSRQKQSQKKPSETILGQLEAEQNCEKNIFILQNEESKEKQASGQNCPLKQLIPSPLISHLQHPGQSNKQKNCQVSRTEISNPSAEDAVTDLKKQQKSEKDPLNFQAPHDSNVQKKQNALPYQQQATINNCSMQKTTQQTRSIPQEINHLPLHAELIQSQSKARQTSYAKKEQKQENVGYQQKQIWQKQNQAVTFSKKQQNFNIVSDKNAIAQKLSKQEIEHSQQLQNQQKVTSSSIVKQNIEEIENQIIKVLQNSQEIQQKKTKAAGISATNAKQVGNMECKPRKQKECSINIGDQKQRQIYNAARSKPLQSSQNNKNTVKNPKAILTLQNGSNSLRSLASSGSQIQLMPLQPSSSQGYLNGQDKIMSRNSKESAQKLGSSIKSISQSLESQKQRKLNTLVKVSPRHHMKNKTEPKPSSKKSLEGFSSSQLLSSNSKISSSHKLQNARDSSNKQNNNQSAQIKKIGFFKFKENKEQYKHQFNKYINESIDEREEVNSKPGKVYQSPLKRRNVNKKIKIPSPYFSSAFSNLKLGSSKNQTLIKHESNEKDYMQNNQEKHSKNYINHDDSDKYESNLKKKYKKPAALFNQREMLKLTVEYQKIKKIQESENVRKQKLLLVEKDRQKQKQKQKEKEHTASLDRHKNHTKSQKFLKAHSHQFSYLYPTTEMDEEEKLNQKVKQLDKKLKRSSYTMGKRREQDEVHEQISQARREIRQSQQFLAEFES